MDLVFPVVLAVALLALGPMLLAVPDSEQPKGSTPEAAAARSRAASRNRAARMFRVALALVLATVLSSTSMPSKLPGSALDSLLVFHIERGAFVLALVGTAVLVGYRATRGEFPLKFGPWLEYADKRATDEARENTLTITDGLRADNERTNVALESKFQGLWEKLGRDVTDLRDQQETLTGRVGELER